MKRWTVLLATKVLLIVALTACGETPVQTPKLDAGSANEAAPLNYVVDLASREVPFDVTFTNLNAVDWDEITLLGPEDYSESSTEQAATFTITNPGYYTPIIDGIAGEHIEAREAPEPEVRLPIAEFEMLLEDDVIPTTLHVAGNYYGDLDGYEVDGQQYFSSSFSHPVSQAGYHEVVLSVSLDGQTRTYTRGFIVGWPAFAKNMNFPLIQIRIFKTYTMTPLWGTRPLSFQIIQTQKYEPYRSTVTRERCWSETS